MLPKNYILIAIVFTVGGKINLIDSITDTDEKYLIKEVHNFARVSASKVKRATGVTCVIYQPEKKNLIQEYTFIPSDF